MSEPVLAYIARPTLHLERWLLAITGSMRAPTAGLTTHLKPAGAIRREPSAGDDAMKMRVVQERLSPCVEHGDEADRRTEMARTGGDGAEGPGRPAV